MLRAAARPPALPAPRGRRLARLGRGLEAPAVQLGLAATVHAALVAVFLVAPLPLWAGHPFVPPPPSSSTTPDDPAAAPLAASLLLLLFELAMCLAFRPYHLALRAAQRAAGRLPGRLLVGLTALLGLVAALMYPAAGSDIFDYVGFERMWVVYGDNPLHALPLHHLADWSTQFVWFPDRTPAYGPLWSVLTWPIVWLAGDAPMAEVIGYKLLSILAYAACCWLVWATADPWRRQSALVLFAWSPLVLFDVLGKVHNDSLPALAALLAVWCLRRRRPGLSLPALAAGGLVKASALVAGPALLVYAWRRARWRAVLAGVALAALLTLALYAPFWEGPRTLAPIWNQTSRLVWGPTSLLLVASQWPPGGPYDAVIRSLMALAWVTFAVGLVARARLDDATDVASASGWLTLAGVLLLTSAVYAHYLVAAVALAAVSSDARLQRVVFWLSIGGLAAYGVDLLGLALGRDWLGSDAYRVLGSLVLLAPVAAALLLDRRWDVGQGSRHAAA